MTKVNLIIVLLNLLVSIILEIFNLKNHTIVSICLGVNLTIIIQSAFFLFADFYNLKCAKHNIKVILKYIEKEVK